MNLAFLGAGAWGTALASHAAAAHAVVLWGRDAGQLAAMAASGVNADYLPGVPLSERLGFEADFARAAAHALCAPDGLVIVATPVSGLREMTRRLATEASAHGVPLRMLWLCKGFEAGTHAMPHQMVAEELAAAGASVPVEYGVLTGPSFAREVALGLPCALTVAGNAPAIAELAQRAFHHRAMRIYGSDDLVGVEVGGAVKNVLAIATGASDGLGLGLNARAALVTRGLAEMTRLGLALGGRAETFMGLAGMGDLILTATGDLSRNRKVGQQLAGGRTLEQVLAELGHVAEGVRCAQAVAALADQHGVEMPITRAVCAVLFEGLAVADAVTQLLQRDARDE
ncbi:NAD(P)-dependent glycerol-3-phosphate dehydrogenase [Cupriavidus cauae]|uniref:NAD(P)H-dependent glycerol-3-phosphate dehydrogenase n=1 Tax=Cupriavidus TaxID=106589 RepID=UPI001CF35542|nr:MULTISPECIES: NAD(P)H-dependent glycerol-3-phosphate dehydrogenase [Cupriavidus]MCA7085157.1 NAD(P)-dependent glycerol-3-phosphate dehydrogenase [Cupriavidus sp. DB3]UZN50048.1 NAD(P)-dependent glycerol-3-phosphate dehydrogenase [Cupriavidus cauae]